MSHFVHFRSYLVLRREKTAADRQRGNGATPAHRITACSQGLFDRTHHHTYCWDESPILWGLLEQKSFRQLRKRRVAQAASSGSCDGSEVARITLTFHPFWLLWGWKLSDAKFGQSAADFWRVYRNRKHCTNHLFKTKLESSVCYDTDLFLHCSLSHFAMKKTLLICLHINNMRCRLNEGVFGPVCSSFGPNCGA